MQVQCLCALLLQEDPDRDYGKKARRREAEQARRAQRSGFVRELMEEIEGAPEEASVL
jgi:hypothetical protein